MHAVHIQLEMARRIDFEIPPGQRIPTALPRTFGDDRIHTRKDRFKSDAEVKVAIGRETACISTRVCLWPKERLSSLLQVSFPLEKRRGYFEKSFQVHLAGHNGWGTPLRIKRCDPRRRELAELRSIENRAKAMMSPIRCTSEPAYQDAPT